MLASLEKMPSVYRQCVRILAVVICWIIPLNVMAAVPIEEVTLEEEPAPAAKSNKAESAPKKKKRKKRKKRRASSASDGAAASSTASKSKVKAQTEAEPQSDSEAASDESAEPAPKKKRRTKKAASASDGDDASEKAPPEPDEPPVPIDCFPELTEVETRRPIPLACTIDKPVSSMELRYRPPGEQWKTAPLKKVGDEWRTDIPCAATAKTGELELTVTARSKKSKTAGKLDPIKVKLVNTTSQAPPSLPGQEAPARCFEPGECPGDMLGTAACPGTKKGLGVRSWGASCAETVECSKGLACVAGTCESPPKCEADNECESGVCAEGVCAILDAEELKTRLGPPRYHWIGLEFGADLAVMGAASGVCGSESSDSESYDCFDGGDEYDGLPNVNNAGKLGSSIRLATMRAMVSYHRAMGRLLVGGRLGFAFRGSPEGFLPLHVEARGAYSLIRDPLKKRFRPYLGLALGLAQVDAQAGVTIINCNTQQCAEAPQIDSTQIMLGQAQLKDMTAYRSGKKFFFGPTFSLIYALSNESGIVFTTNVRFPDIVIAPSVGYMLGL